MRLMRLRRCVFLLERAASRVWLTSPLSPFPLFSLHQKQSKLNWWKEHKPVYSNSVFSYGYSYEYYFYSSYVALQLKIQSSHISFQADIISLIHVMFLALSRSSCSGAGQVVYTLSSLFFFVVVFCWEQLPAASGSNSDVSVTSE